MGRHRLHADPAGDLPAGLYKARRQYRALDANRKWVYFGSEYQAAVDGYLAWKGQTEVVKTVGWLMQLCVGKLWPDRVKAKELSPRTARDYQRDSKIIIAGLGKIPLIALQPKHIVLFRDIRAAVTSHVRNEMACLAAALTIAVERGDIKSNPAREVARPKRHIRERLITDDEYLAVYEKATRSERLAMILCVRTLGLPGDVLRYGPKNLRKYADGLSMRDVPIDQEPAGSILVGQDGFGVEAVGERQRPEWGRKEAQAAVRRELKAEVGESKAVRDVQLSHGPCDCRTGALRQSGAWRFRSVRALRALELQLQSVALGLEPLRDVLGCRGMTIGHLHLADCGVALALGQRQQSPGFEQVRLSREAFSSLGTQALLEIVDDEAQAIDLPLQADDDLRRAIGNCLRLPVGSSISAKHPSELDGQRDDAAAEREPRRYSSCSCGINTEIHSRAAGWQGTRTPREPRSGKRLRRQSPEAAAVRARGRSRRTATRP